METIKDIWFEEGRIYMLSSEDKVYSRPLEAFPLLKDATKKQWMDYIIELHGEALRWAELDEGIHISSFYTKDESRYDNEVATLSKHFPQLNVSEVARNLGTNKNSLSKCIYDVRNPSAERVCQIKNALRVLGKELAAM